MAARELTDEQLKLLDVFEYNGLTLAWFVETVSRAKYHLIECKTPMPSARGQGDLRSHWLTSDIGMLTRVEYSLAKDAFEVPRESDTKHHIVNAVQVGEMEYKIEPQVTLTEGDSLTVVGIEELPRCTRCGGHFGAGGHGPGFCPDRRMP